MQPTVDSVLPDLSRCDSMPSELPLRQAKRLELYRGPGSLTSLVSESNERTLVGEPGCGVVNLRFRLSELCLTEFHN